MNRLYFRPFLGHFSAFNPFLISHYLKKKIGPYSTFGVFLSINYTISSTNLAPYNSAISFVDVFTCFVDVYLCFVENCPIFLHISKVRNSLIFSNLQLLTYFFWNYTQVVTYARARVPY